MNLEIKLQEKQTKYAEQLESIGDQNNKLEMLKEKCEAFIKACNEYRTTQEKLEMENAMLKQQFQQIQKEQLLIREEQMQLQRKRDDVSNVVLEDLSEDLEHLYLLLGYRITKFEPMQNKARQITLHFNDTHCYVEFTIAPNANFELVNIFPAHPNLLQIKQFLHTTQDMRGLLAAARKFFILQNNLMEQKNVNENAVADVNTATTLPPNQLV